MSAMVWPCTMFQSAPRSGDRGDEVASGGLRGEAVSIRASVRRPRRQARKQAGIDCLGFNPRLGPETEATLGLYRAKVVGLFQSAPRSGDRGDPDPLPPPDRAGVSIRASVRRPRRRVAGREGHREGGFNPRLGPETEATRGGARARCPRVVSIRASVRRPRRRFLRVDPLAGDVFQSAPRSGDRGDRNVSTRGASGCTFQSAPRSGDRGDPPFSESSSLSRKFQSAPRSGDRGDDSRRRRPPRFQVSIRASVRRPRRRSVARWTRRR